ncbi:MAG: hypothetical protein V4631_10095 [Pseudomonadota bacterium]
MTLFRTFFLAAILPVCASSAHAMPRFDAAAFKADEQKSNVSFNFTEGAVGAGEAEDSFDGMLGTTLDVKGQKTMFWVTFGGSVPEARMFELLNKQGRLSGTIHCKQIHIGTGALVPKPIKYGFWGVGCALKSAG